MRFLQLVQDDLVRASNFFYEKSIFILLIGTLYQRAPSIYSHHIYIYIFRWNMYVFAKKIPFFQFRSKFSFLLNLVKYIYDFEFDDKFKKWFRYQFNLTGLHAHNRPCGMHVDCRNQINGLRIAYMFFVEVVIQTNWK